MYKRCDVTDMGELQASKLWVFVGQFVSVGLVWFWFFLLFVEEKIILSEM